MNVFYRETGINGIIFVVLLSLVSHKKEPKPLVSTKKEHKHRLIL